MKMFRAALKFRVPVDLLLTLFTLLILIGYTYIKFWVVPYTGFYISNPMGRVETVYTISNPEQIIKEGDIVVAVNDIDWKEDFQLNLRQHLFEGVEPGQSVTLTIERDGEQMSIEWQMPGRNPQELQGRIVDTWWLAYVFFLAGLATSILIRPKDIRWWLLLLFYYLTAIWILVGTDSSHHVGMSALVMRSVLWLCVPIYIHLHWVYPVPFKKLPTSFWLFLYLSGMTAVVAEWLSLLPHNAYFIAALIAMGGTILLIFAHYIFQPSQRASIKLLVITVLLAFVPLAGIAIVSLISIQPPTGSLALITLPAIPAVYFYTAYRRRTGWLELRANRFAALYLFLLLLIALVILINPFIGFLNLPGDSVIRNVLTVLGASLLTAIGLRPFQRFVEKQLLGIPIPYEQLVTHFSKSIVTSFTRPQLIQVLQEEIVPSLLIKQSTLLQFPKQELTDILYIAGLTQTDIPNNLGTHPDTKGSDELLQSKIMQLLPWVRLALPLRAESKLIGLWLLGNHDPDDMYRQEEVNLLKLLADQISIALTNIQQSEQLLALYKNSIDHQEIEKANLARLLHDEILNDLALLAKVVSEAEPNLEATYHSLVTRIRQTIITLRPALMDFGLWAALDELIDTLNQLSQGKVEILFDANYTTMHYPVAVEQNLLRVIQLAIENALKHAEADLIEVHGQFESESIKFTVIDNGVGFLIGDQLGLMQFRNNNHFGLAHMHERCELIKADLQVTSNVGQGTAVAITWDNRTKSA